MSPKKIIRPAATSPAAEVVENAQTVEAPEVVKVPETKDAEVKDAAESVTESDIIENDVTASDITEEATEDDTAEVADDEVPSARPRSRTPAGRARRIGGVPTSLTVAEPTATHTATGQSKRAVSGRVVSDWKAAGLTGSDGFDESVTAQPRTATKNLFTASRVAATIAAVLIVGLALANVLVWHPWHKDDSSKDTALIQRILSTAKQSTAPVISYDYRNWDKSVSAAVGGLAGQFKKDYTAAMASYKDKAVTAQAVTVAQVDNAGLVSINSKGSEATVAVYVERTVTNTSNTDPREDLLAVTEILDRVNGQWKITKLSFIN